MTEKDEPMDTVTTKFLSPAEASAYLREKGVRRAPSTLAKIRCVEQDGPIFIRVKRAIFYPAAGLDAYATSIISAPMRSTKNP